jgi:hypothetical protein
LAHYVLVVGQDTEVTGRRRGQLFVYSEHLAILNEGAEPLP